jgi:glutamate dehydrogenase/leucine dehydrogenase
MTTDILTSLGNAGDALGPESVTVLRHPGTGVTAVVVVDNLACGPAIGGVRMATDITVEEIGRLARAMTLKNAAARLPHGGAKAGIVADPSMCTSDREQIIRWFGNAIRELTCYVPGPDMGTDERCMAWIHDEIGRSVGLPAALGGIPLDELGATGLGLAVAAEAVEDAGLLSLRGARVAVQGFGAVGQHASRLLAERDAQIVALSDSSGAVFEPSGLPLDALLAWKRAGNHLDTFDGMHIAPEELLALDCEILVPAARPDAITEANADDVKAAVILEGANIPVAGAAEARLHERGVLCLPDWIVNAGGVICAAVERSGGTWSQAQVQIDETIRANTAEIVKGASDSGDPPRVVAERFALARLHDAMALRRSFA